MKTNFLGAEYVALALIKAKNQFFHESFITMSELNQFNHFLQQEFNNRNLNVVITSNALSPEDFNIRDEVVTLSENCYLNLDFLSINVLTVLYDTNLIMDFLIKLEKEKLELLKRKKSEGFKIYKKQYY